MIAILSDIHANLEALTVVLDDIARRNVSRVFCLGDTVGYGPDPESSLSLVREFDVVLRGHFDNLVLNDDPDTLAPLRQLAAWARHRLSADSLDWLNCLPERHVDGGCAFSHGSPPDNGYLFPEHVFDPHHMARVFNSLHVVHFCGHSHMAGIHTRSEYIPFDSLDCVYEMNGSPAVINVGSVGQPRDSDNRACYVLYDGQTVRFVRLEYDMDTTRRKLRDSGSGTTYWDL